MSSPRIRRFLVLAGLTIVAASSAAGSAQRQIDLPADTATYESSDLPGYALVQRHCFVCHSAEYVLMQPSTSSRAYWDATVKKMKRPFGAPFSDEDVPAMVEYLVKTYGAER